MMTFLELREAIRKITTQEISAAVDYYFEAVISKAHLEDLTVLLQSYFGESLKPAGQPAREEMDRMAGRYGGIRTHQVLYALKTEKGNDIALLWPWANGERFTLKIIQDNSKNIPRV